MPIINRIRKFYCSWSFYGTCCWLYFRSFGCPWGVHNFVLRVVGIFLGFDIWQFFTSSYEWLAIVAGICVLVSFLGHAGVMSLNATMYWLVCLTAAFLLALGIVPGAEKLWKAIGDFQISVLATVMSAVIPTVGAAFTAGVIWLKREIFN